MQNHVIICATRPHGSEASASNYHVYLFFSNHTPFVPSPTADLRQTTKRRQVNLRTEIEIVDRKGSVYPSVYLLYRHDVTHVILHTRPSRFSACNIEKKSTQSGSCRKQLYIYLSKASRTVEALSKATVCCCVCLEWLEDNS